LKLSSKIEIKIPNKSAQTADQLYWNNNQLIQIRNYSSIGNQLTTLQDPSSIENKEIVHQLELTKEFQYSEKPSCTLTSRTTISSDW